MLSDSRGFKILKMFDRASWPTITESVVESADSAVESAYSMADSSEDPVKISLWVWAFNDTGGFKRLAFLRINSCEF